MQFVTYRQIIKAFSFVIIINVAVVREVVFLA